MGGILNWSSALTLRSLHDLLIIAHPVWRAWQAAPWAHSQNILSQDVSFIPSACPLHVRVGHCSRLRAAFVLAHASRVRVHADTAAVFGMYDSSSSLQITR